MFADDADHQRFQQFSSAGTTTYMAASGTTAERLDGSGGSTQWTNYFVAGGELVSMRVENGGTVYTRYFNKDHLGSIAVISNETGAAVERLSYEAWGKRRYPDGTDDTTGSITSQTTRGFTGHEELADVALVHMNGRVY
jgi:predicted enzyme related to lactoylglutathione lyase